MNHSLIMKCAAAVSAVFGLALLFAPNALLALYKAEQMNGPGIYNSMLYGGTLIALAVMNWNASQGSVLEARHVILGSFVAFAIGLVVALIRQLTDASIPASAWMNVVLFLVFGVLYAYLQFGQQRMGSPAAGSPT